jgi:hypothetical protein
MTRPVAEGGPREERAEGTLDERPASLTWALRLIGVLVLFAGVVVLLMVLRNDDLIRAWAQGNPSAKRVLETEGIEALKHPATDNRVRAPHFIAPAVTLYGVLVGLIWVLSVFLRNGFEWARICLTVLLLFTAVASVGGILTGPPALFVVLTVIAIAIGVSALVLAWMPDTTRYIHPPADARPSPETLLR